MSYIGHGSLKKILSFFFITIYNKKKIFIGFTLYKTFHPDRNDSFFPFL